MAISILNSIHSFVRFDDPAPAHHCIWGSVDYCLPVYDQEDVYFQFVLSGTEAEMDALCTTDNSGVTVSVVSDCLTAPILTFAEKPQRFRLSLTQVLYNWSHGLPNFTSVISVKECFKLQVEVLGIYSTQTFCSNCFERIASDCFTSIIEYGNDEDGFGFKYCYGGDIEPGGSVVIDCEPTIVQFIGLATLAIPYTAGLQASYGVFPTVQVWIYDGLGQLVNMGITAAFDQYPPTMINLDFGGVATGIVVIR